MNLVGKLYSPEEQLGHLAASLYPETSPPELPPMSDNDRETYSSRLETWLPEHPFLDANGQGASSAVFGGMIASHALRIAGHHNGTLATRILGEKINPFLARFYFDGLTASSGQEGPIPAGHVGVLYASVRASLSMGEIARLRVEGEVDEGDLGETAEAEITKTRDGGGEWKPLRFDTDAGGGFHLGSRVENVDMAVPGAEVTLGPGSDAVLVAPVSINSGAIYFDVNRVVAEVSPGRLDKNGGDCDTVWLGAEDVVELRLQSRPICREGAQLGFSGTWAGRYPWRDFRVAREENPDPQIASAERALLRILRLFRSRQSGVMGAPRAAIDAPRRSRGAGSAVRDQLLEESVLTEKEDLYELDSGLLATRTGLTIQLVHSRQTKPETFAFLKRALSRSH